MPDDMDVTAHLAADAPCQVALDLDSTIAATCAVGFELLGDPDRDYDDIDCWNWGLDEYGERFLHAMWHAWSIRPTDVPPLEPDLPATIDTLRETNHVDIVTAHPPKLEAVAAGKEAWIAQQGITVDDFVVAQDKPALGYDVYIDDKPALVDAVDSQCPDATCIVRDQPYNRHLDLDGDHVRIPSLGRLATQLRTLRGVHDD